MSGYTELETPDKLINFPFFLSSRFFIFVFCKAGRGGGGDAIVKPIRMKIRRLAIKNKRKRLAKRLVQLDPADLNSVISNFSLSRFALQSFTIGFVEISLFRAIFRFPESSE